MHPSCRLLHTVELYVSLCHTTSWSHLVYEFYFSTYSTMLVWIATSGSCVVCLQMWCTNPLICHCTSYIYWGLLCLIYTRSTNMVTIQSINYGLLCTYYCFTTIVEVTLLCASCSSTVYVIYCLCTVAALIGLYKQFWYVIIKLVRVSYVT
jgi:hypothetical protein